MKGSNNMSSTTGVNGPKVNAIYGRELIEEIDTFARAPYLVVTMEDLWPLIENKINIQNCRVYYCKTLEYNVLIEDLKKYSNVKSIVAIGGGFATDTAKFFSWLLNLPIFIFPTSLSVNAFFTPKAGIRKDGVVQYLGWVKPEAVFCDLDVLKEAPLHINRSGVGDVFCIHTAHYDWNLATKRNKEKKWPWNDELAEDARNQLQSVRKNIKEINEMTEDAIKLIMEVHRWTGALWINSGWNNRWTEGCEHFFFYNLEFLTRKHFIHGEPVCLGIILVTAFTGQDHESIKKDILDIGVRVHPGEMGVSEEDIIEAFASCKDYSEKNGLFYTAINEIKVDKPYIRKVLKSIN